MNRSVSQPQAWSDLGIDRTRLVVSGTFQLDAATYDVKFYAEAELSRFMQFLLAMPGKPAVSRMYLHPNITPMQPEHILSNLRFQFDSERQVAAAVLIFIDQERGTVASWMTSGDSGRDDVMLTYDSWNEDESMFPSDSFITISELRETVQKWAFGHLFPPPTVKWVEVGGLGLL